MLAIGRSLMGKPKMLMLDEPSLGLAPIVVGSIFRIIKEINRLGVTILLVEQNLRQALAISARAYVIENGVIAMRGESKILLKDENIMKTYLGM
jgi:branched-chain amino acid transport system ATP-binding protein